MARPEPYPGKEFFMNFEYDGFVFLKKRELLPGCSGIYFVVSEDQVFYIGKSTNMKARFLIHHKLGEFQKLLDAKIFWKTYPPDKLDEIERNYILSFSPLLNKVILPAINNRGGAAISGRFYSSNDLQEILNVSRQRVHNLGVEQDWLAIAPGLYCAQDVDSYLESRGIDPLALPIRDYDYPDGATLAQRNAEYMEAIED